MCDAPRQFQYSSLSAHTGEKCLSELNPCKTTIVMANDSKVEVTNIKEEIKQIFMRNLTEYIVALFKESN